MESSVRPFGLVIAFCILKYGKLQLLKGSATFTVCLLFLRIFEKAFAAGIVKWIAYL